MMIWRKGALVARTDWQQGSDEPFLAWMVHRNDKGFDAFGDAHALKKGDSYD